MNESKSSAIQGKSSTIGEALSDLRRRNEELSNVMHRLSIITATLCGHSCKLEPDEKAHPVAENMVHDLRISINDQVDTIGRIENLLGRLEEVV